MAATLRLIQRFLPVTGAAYRWQRALGQAPKDVPSAPERVMPRTVGKSPSGGSWQDKGSLWQGQGGFGAETPTYSSYPLPSPRGSVSKDDLMGFYLLFLRCNQCTSLCHCSGGSAKACVRSVIYGIFTEQEPAYTGWFSQRLGTSPARSTRWQN